MGGEDDKPIQIRVPLERWVADIATHAAKQAARCVIEEHERRCPIRDVAARVERMQLRLALLIGAMLGSGLLGGVAGTLLAKIGGP